jgi:CBS domain-containing protein
MYPVTDAGGVFLGMLSRETIERAAREESMERPVQDALEQPKLVALATELVIDLVGRMQLSGADRSPVLDNEQSRRVVGFVSPSDILRMRIRSKPAEEESPFEIFE